MEQLEVMPVSSRVVCLNAPHLKSLCVFEALSRTLGCYYNHHRPQVTHRGEPTHAHLLCVWIDNYYLYVAIDSMKI